MTKAVDQYDVRKLPPAKPLPSRVYGYGGTLLEVDLTTGHVTRQRLDSAFAKEWIGGRGFGVRMIYERVPEKMNAFDPKSVMFIGGGVLAGTLFPGNSRTDFVAKSPLGQIGWSNMGGHFAADLKQCGVDGIVVTGRSSSPVYLRLTESVAELHDATPAWGQEVAEAAEWLVRDSRLMHPEIVLIGPAGERRVRFASIMSYGRLSYKAAGRTGLGAVMGSKNLKGIVVRGRQDVAIADPATFFSVTDEVTRFLRSEPEVANTRKYGTSGIVDGLSAKGSLVTRNFQQGTFSAAKDLGAEALKTQYLWKVDGCQACYHLCARHILVREGRFRGLSGKGPEYQNLICLGSNLGITKLDEVLQLSSTADELGMDIVSAGITMSFALELWQRGLLTEEDTEGLLLEWGRFENIHTLLRWIGYREHLGDMLAEGTRAAAAKIQRGAAKYAMQSKGLEVSTGDPRGQYGFALAYAVCSRGPDTQGALPRFEYGEEAEAGRAYFGSEEASTRFGVKGKGRLVRFQEDLYAVYDSLNICKRFLAVVSSFSRMLDLSFPMLSRLYSAATGIPISTEEMALTGERIMNLERLFNVRQGLRRRDDTLPDRFLKEPLREGASAGHVVPLDVMLDEYYTARGWDLQTGVPTPETLRRVGLAWAIPDLPYD